MSVAEEKSFVLRHTFQNVREMGKDWENKVTSEAKEHFDFSWRLRLFKNDCFLHIHLDCDADSETEWACAAQIEASVSRKNGGEYQILPLKSFSLNGHRTELLGTIVLRNVKNYLINDNFYVECHVTINKVIGLTLRQLETRLEKVNFDDESRKKFSDVTLIVMDQKFYVNKMYLAGHSKYFESLLLGNFEESKKSEVELKDIEPEDFQNFLELIHGESVVNAENIDGILHLADMYDSKTAIKRCEEFLIKNPKNISFKEEFEMAIKYKMDVLKEKCLVGMRSADDIRSVIPENSDQMDISTWKLLLDKSLELLDKH